MQTDARQPGALPAAVLPDTEAAARDYLVSAGVLRFPSCCPVCGSTAIRNIRRNQCRCRGCRHEWSIRNGTILEGLRISFRTFFSIARYFADDLPANEAARRMSIAYNTVYEVYRRIRSAILVPDSVDPAEGAGEPEHPVTKETPGTESTLNGRYQVLFGIRLVDGRILIERVSIPDPGIIVTLPIPNMQRGNIMFIDAYGKKYQGFITYTADRHGKDVVRIRARDELPWSPLGNFWTFAGSAWMSHRGIEREHIPEFVQELAFRYNHRHEDILPLVLERIAASFPGT